MGRAIDMEASIDTMKASIEKIEAALEKVINWISEEEDSRHDTPKQHKSKATKKSAKTTKVVSDVQEDGEH
tara:strand:- start:446 stop:658 length:213 start_codon:yes stop_codon:yes gene_type:complete